MARLLGCGNSSQGRETRENQARASPHEKGSYGNLLSSQALVDRSEHAKTQTIWQSYSVAARILLRVGRQKQILHRWIQAPDTPYIVATTSLAEGFDYPHVRLVVNVDGPESLVIFAQESDRAGRDGKRAYSMVLLLASWQPQVTDDPLDDPYKIANHRNDLTLQKRWDRQAAHQYLQGKQCYRKSLSDYLAVAHDRRWSMPEDVPCDVCGVAHQNMINPAEKVEQDTAHTGLQFIKQERLRAHTELAQYRLDLANVKGTCLLCRAVKSSWENEFSTCARGFEVFEKRSKARQLHTGCATAKPVCQGLFELFAKKQFKPEF
jgi:hypothetical protein